MSWAIIGSGWVQLKDISIIQSWAGFTETIRQVDFSPFMRIFSIFVLILILSLFLLWTVESAPCIILTTEISEFTTLLSLHHALLRVLGLVKIWFMVESQVTYYVMWWLYSCLHPTQRDRALRRPRSVPLIKRLGGSHWSSSHEKYYLKAAAINVFIPTMNQMITYDMNGAAFSDKYTDDPSNSHFPSNLLWTCCFGFPACRQTKLETSLWT